MQTHVLMVAGVLSATAWLSTAQEIRKELATRHAPVELLRPVLENSLSPQGRFVILPGKGKVLVIDTADKVRAAELALAAMQAPMPEVRLNFAVNPGNPVPGKTRFINPPEAWSDFPFPTAYLAPGIVADGSGGFVVTPAHPTNFKRRKVGDTLETTPTANADGSVTVDINARHSDFGGFINYGSAIFGSGSPGIVPLVEPVPEPEFFAPLINTGPNLMPVFDTTRISTQVIVRPTVSHDIVTVEMIPQLRVNNSKNSSIEKEKTISLKQYRTRLQIRNGKVGAVNGFTGASPEFNQAFLGGEQGRDGLTTVKIRANIRPGKAYPAVDSPGLEKQGDRPP